MHPLRYPKRVPQFYVNSCLNQRRKRHSLHSNRMSAELRLATRLCGLALKNPVLAASGTFGAYGVEFADLVDLNRVGGIVVKGLSREPMAGNRPPRVWEAEGGMVNSIGLQNIGVHAFVREKLPELSKFTAAIFANVFGYAVEDYAEVVRVLEGPRGAGGVRAERQLSEHRSTAGCFFRAIRRCWPR